MSLHWIFDQISDIFQIIQMAFFINLLKLCKKSNLQLLFEVRNTTMTR